MSFYPAHTAFPAAPGWPMCLSYGIDFQNGGSYFQNSQSSAEFTFVSQFEGCQRDTAYNTLVDPNGHQILCSNTDLQPDNTNELSTCPIQQDQLFSGPWSIIIMSNNGAGAPIVYQRDFSLSVGLQITSIITPTVTNTFVSTPVSTSYATTTDTATNILPAKTVTSASATQRQTSTIHPSQLTQTSTQALLTVQFTAYSAAVRQVTTTATATCITPTRAAHDQEATIRPTAALLAMRLSAKFGRQLPEADRARFVEERKARMLAARAPDPQPLIITETDPAKYATVVMTSLAAGTTVTMTTAVTTTTTSTPAAITVLNGQSTAPIVTVTASQPVKTVVTYDVVTEVTTSTVPFDYTVTTTTTPPGVSRACRTAGGMLY